MNHRERLTIAAIWIRVAKKNKIETAIENHALRQLYTLCQERPHDAWQIIVAIAEADPTTTTASLLGKGPIREIMVYHGIRFLKFIEEHAVKNQALQFAIDQVWNQKTFSLPMRSAKLRLVDVKDSAAL